MSEYDIFLRTEKQMDFFVSCLDTPSSEYSAADTMTSYSPPPLLHKAPTTSHALSLALVTLLLQQLQILVQLISLHFRQRRMLHNAVYNILVT